MPSTTGKLTPSQEADLREEYSDVQAQLNDLADNQNSAQARRVRARLVELDREMADAGVSPIAPKRFGRTSTPEVAPQPARGVESVRPVTPARVVEPRRAPVGNGAPPPPPPPDREKTQKFKDALAAQGFKPDGRPTLSAEQRATLDRKAAPQRYQTFADRMAGDMSNADRLAAHVADDEHRRQLRAQEAESARQRAEARANDTRTEREKLTDLLQEQRAARDVDMRSGRLDPKREARIKAAENRLDEINTEDRKAKIKALGVQKGDKVKTALGEFEVTGRTADGHLRVLRPDGRRGTVRPGDVEAVTKAGGKRESAHDVILRQDFNRTVQPDETPPAAQLDRLNDATLQNMITAHPGTPLAAAARAALDRRGARPKAEAARTAAPAAKTSAAMADARTAVRDLGGVGEWASVADVRDRLAARGYTREQQDAAFMGLLDDPEIRMVPQANRKALTTRQHQGAFHIDKFDEEGLHAIMIRKPQISYEEQEARLAASATPKAATSEAPARGRFSRALKGDALSKLDTRRDNSHDVGVSNAPTTEANVTTPDTLQANDRIIIGNSHGTVLGKPHAFTKGDGTAAYQVKVRRSDGRQGTVTFNADQQLNVERAGSRLGEQQTAGHVGDRPRTGTYTGEIKADSKERFNDKAFTDHVKTLTLVADSDAEVRASGFNHSDQPLQVGDEVMVHTFNRFRRGIVTGVTRNGKGNARVAYSTPSGGYVQETTAPHGQVWQLTDPAIRPRENKAALLPPPTLEARGPRRMTDEEKAASKAARAEAEKAAAAQRRQRFFDEKIDGITAALNGGEHADNPEWHLQLTSEDGLVSLAKHLGVKVPNRGKNSLGNPLPRDRDALHKSIIDAIRVRQGKA